MAARAQWTCAHLTPRASAGCPSPAEPTSVKTAQRRSSPDDSAMTAPRPYDLDLGPTLCTAPPTDPEESPPDCTTAACCDY